MNTIRDEFRTWKRFLAACGCKDGLEVAYKGFLVMVVLFAAWLTVSAWILAGSIPGGAQ